MKKNNKESKNLGVTRRTFLKVAGVGGLAATTIGFPSVLRGAEPKEILIGSIHPITGPAAYDGTSVAQGFQLAFDQKNEAGGIKSMGGAKLKVLLMDTEANPKIGEAAAEKLIQDRCVALGGAYNSPVSMVTTHVAERHGIPHIITVASADEILQRNFRYTFRVQQDNSIMAGLTCKYARQLSDKYNMNLKTVAHLNLTGMGSVINNELRKLGPNYGFEIVGGVSYGYGVSDLTTEISKIKAMNADVVIDSGYFADGLLKVRTYNDLKVEPRGGFFGCGNGAFGNPAAVKELGRLAEGLMDGNYYHNTRSDFARSVVAEYNKRFTKVVFQPHSVFAYDAGLVLVDALERAGSADPQKLRDAIASTNLTKHIAPGGAIKFDSKGQNINATITLQQVQNREIKVVMPDEYAETKPIYPIPRWNEKV